MDHKRQLLMGAAAAALALSVGCKTGTKGMASGAHDMGKGECYGINSCKGQGACGGEGHECAGQNSCKGKGWLALTKAECDAKGGQFKPG